MTGINLSGTKETIHLSGSQRLLRFAKRINELVHISRRYLGLDRNSTALSATSIHRTGENRQLDLFPGYAELAGVA